MADYTYTQAYAFGVTNEGEAFTVTNQLAAVVATGIVGSGGSGVIELIVPDDSISVLTFTRDSDSRVLATVVFDPREIPSPVSAIIEAIRDMADFAAGSVWEWMRGRVGLIGVASMAVTAPIAADGKKLTLTQGADYTAQSGWPVQFALTGPAAVKAYEAGITELRLIAANSALNVVGTFAATDNGFDASFDVGRAKTAALKDGVSRYYIEATLDNETETPTLASGFLEVQPGGVQ